MQEPQARMGFAMLPEEDVVQNEHGRQCVGPPAGVGERRVVVDAEIVPEPVYGVHGKNPAPDQTSSR